jgi:hypothetical protein
VKGDASWKFNHGVERGDRREADNGMRALGGFSS